MHTFPLVKSIDLYQAMLFFSENGRVCAYRSWILPEVFEHIYIYIKESDNLSIYFVENVEDGKAGGKSNRL